MPIMVKFIADIDCAEASAREVRGITSASVNSQPSLLAVAYATTVIHMPANSGRSSASANQARWAQRRRRDVRRLRLQPRYWRRRRSGPKQCWIMNFLMKTMFYCG